MKSFRQVPCQSLNFIRGSPLVSYNSEKAFYYFHIKMETFKGNWTLFKSNWALSEYNYRFSIWTGFLYMGQGNFYIWMINFGFFEHIWLARLETWIEWIELWILLSLLIWKWPSAYSKVQKSTIFSVLQEELPSCIALEATFIPLVEKSVFVWLRTSWRQNKKLKKKTDISSLHGFE